MRPQTRTFYGPGCPTCGTVYASRQDAQPHSCTPDAVAAWQTHLAERDGKPLPPGLTDLGNGFVLNLPADEG